MKMLNETWPNTDSCNKHFLVNRVFAIYQKLCANFQSTQSCLHWGNFYKFSNLDLAHYFTLTEASKKTQTQEFFKTLNWSLQTLTPNWQEKLKTSLQSPMAWNKTGDPRFSPESEKSCIGYQPHSALGCWRTQINWRVQKRLTDFQKYIIFSQNLKEFRWFNLEKQKLWRCNVSLEWHGYN